MSVFDGKAIVLAGRFSTSALALQQQLEALGAEVTRHVSSRTDFVITGSRPGREKLTLASRLGVNLLTEDEARALMRGEDVEVDRVGRLGERSVDELLGQARGLLDRPMSPVVWQEIIALLDDCKPEQQEVLVGYFEPQLEKWAQPDVRAHAQEVVARQALAMGDEDREALRQALYSLSRQPPQSVRFAPEPWKGEMMQRVPSAKYRLVRSVDLRHGSAPQKKILQLLTHPELTGLRELDLDAHTLPGKANIDALLTHDNFASIEHFSPGNVGPYRVKQLTAATQTRFAPRVLDMYGYYGDVYAEQEVATLVALAHAPCFEGVETLILSDGGSRVGRFVQEITEHGLMPHLHTLVWNASAPNPSGSGGMSALYERVSTLVMPLLIFDRRKSSWWSRQLGSKLPGNIDTLDVSGMLFDQGTSRRSDIQPIIFAPDAVTTQAFGELCDSVLLDHVERVRLGPLYFDERVHEVCSTHRPDLVLEQ